MGTDQHIPAVLVVVFVSLVEIVKRPDAVGQRKSVIQISDTQKNIEYILENNFMAQPLPNKSGYYWMRYIHPDGTPNPWEVVRIGTKPWANCGLTTLVNYIGGHPPMPLKHFSESNYEWIPLEIP